MRRSSGKARRVEACAAVGEALISLDQIENSSAGRTPFTELATRLGQRIRELRKLHSLTQEALAERAKISVSFLSMIERADRVPHLKTLVALADGLGISLSEMFAGVGEHTKNRSTALLPLIKLLERLSFGENEVGMLLAIVKAMYKAR